MISLSSVVQLHAACERIQTQPICPVLTNTLVEICQIKMRPTYQTDCTTEPNVYHYALPGKYSKIYKCLRDIIQDKSKS